MCHRIYTFSKCHHIEISDDDVDFPPCECHNVRGFRRLERPCGACIRFRSPSFAVEHKKAVRHQLERYKALGYPSRLLKRHLRDWHKLVGFGSRLLKDHPDDDTDFIMDQILREGSVLDADEDEVSMAADPGIPRVAPDTINEPANGTQKPTAVDGPKQPTIANGSGGKKHVFEKVAPVPKEGAYIVGPSMENFGNVPLTKFMK
ncbi:hypothetical protein TWF481_003125 [Arthrobotrys musiformis]|uniref:C2H2-type domain-containing protein n=1 Tax=Arthrobotrys musiformis TaxID=47236 RepID=A0AAV9VSC5_9PEZI